MASMCVLTPGRQVNSQQPRHRLRDVTDRRIRADALDEAPRFQTFQLDVNLGSRIPDPKFLRLFGADVAAEPATVLRKRSDRSSRIPTRSRKRNMFTDSERKI